MKTSISIAEAGFAPDFLIRLGIRRLLRGRLAQNNHTSEKSSSLLKAMSQGPLAVSTAEANDQHYEVPPAFFEVMLGRHLKYSCALYEDGAISLGEAETAMLELMVERARLSNGQRILELGCGWGSLTLFLAEKFPQSEILAVSNSKLQREYIESQAHSKGLQNVKIETSDMNDFQTNQTFDRVLSIEMFEHMRNYHLLFEQISNWLNPSGMLFFHIFCHKNAPYLFTVDTDDDWMAKHFFTGGVMPSYDLPSKFDKHMVTQERWRVSGLNYADTCQGWLNNLDKKKLAALSALAEGDNPEPVHRQYHRWRMFVMACQELFAYQKGTEWFVGHYLMSRTDTL